MAIRRKKIRELARKMLINYGINKPQVDIAHIIDCEGIKISKKDFGQEVSGFIFRQGRGAIIGINPGQSENRQRFTLAHELGHYLLHSRVGNDVHVDGGKTFDITFRDDRSSLGVYAEEREANFFAAELLMPEHFIKESVKQFPEISITEDLAIVELAKIYGVSTLAMTYRLNYLGIIQI